MTRNIWIPQTTSTITTGTGGFIDLSREGVIAHNHIAVTPVGTRIHFKTSKRFVDPEIVFRFLKSRLNEVEVRSLKARVANLYLLMQDAEETGQKGLFQELQRVLVLAVRDQEAAAAGFDKFVLAKDIERVRSFMNRRYNGIKTLRFENLDNFPRVIPEEPKAKLLAAKSRKLFEEYWVLYNDLTEEGPIATTSDKIRKKDPILFGRYGYDPERYFFIADWVDEYCDLTLSKFCDALSEDGVEKEYVPQKVLEITAADVAEIRKTVEARIHALNHAHAGNFRRLAEEQDTALMPKKKSWWKRFKK